MKVFAKPISSPKRPPPPPPDDLPIITPPLITTFPRSRSKRGSRSRANPMFLTKLNTTANDANLEPSSPKVTCIGQVKIKRRRSKSNNTKNHTTTTAGSTAFRWLRKLKPERFRRVWRRTLSFLRCGYGGKSRKLQESERRRSFSFLRCDNGGKSRKLQESERRTLSFLRCDNGGKSRNLPESERRRSLSNRRGEEASGVIMAENLENYRNRRGEEASRFSGVIMAGNRKKLPESEQIEANNNQKKNDLNLKREIEDVIIVPDNDNNDDNVLISESPPRNAFLLTRSRSASELSGDLRDGGEIGRKLAGNNGIGEGTEAISGGFVVEDGEDEGSINGVEEVIIKGRKRLSLLSRCKSVPGRRRTGDKRFFRAVADWLTLGS
ncbi:hypothetical protein OSB04_013688 [Centaurea solstitialis]|uniref:Uncharacterized protein n=1 Tax=Centaurea solstitialis TaxID=347529 RepID=A0AA38TFI6_9ASTR|nr:hypothetical protein OSB04_013688 [Centaurea solstitialis]